MKNEWKRGQKSELARRVVISRQYLNGILRGRRCTRELARKLERASVEMGIPISRYTWMESDTTENPMFYNKKK